MFNSYLNLCGLIPDGKPYSNLLLIPMKKVVAVWWDGNSVAKVLGCSDSAILLEQATGMTSLSIMSKVGQDERSLQSMELVK